MKLEQQVCSLELAKKLKTLGVKQESFWYWDFYDTDKIINHCDWLNWTAESQRDSTWREMALAKTASAFTVAELGEMLPEEEYVSVRQCETWYGLKSGEPNSQEFFKELAQADTEADARAKMLIYLLENNLIDPQKVRG